jgi:hypothetical protein
MPCNHCYKHFKVKPCNTKLVRGKVKILLNSTTSNHYYPDKMIRKIYRLNYKCPCVNCLVKVMCRDICENYIERIVRD